MVCGWVGGLWLTRGGAGGRPTTLLYQTTVLRMRGWARSGKGFGHVTTVVHTQGALVRRLPYGSCRLTGVSVCDRVENDHEPLVCGRSPHEPMFEKVSYVCEEFTGLWHDARAPCRERDHRKDNTAQRRLHAPP